MDEEFNFEKKKIWKQPKFFVGLGLAGFLATVLIFGGKISGENSVLGNFSAAIYKTFEDILGFKSEKPIYELDLTANNGNNLTSGGEVGGESGGVTQDSDQKSNLERVQQQNQAPIPKADEKNSTTKQVVKKNLSASENQNTVVAEEKVSTNTDASLAKKSSENVFKDCQFSPDSPATSGLSRTVAFNEIAWMGGKDSSNDEWMEIKNNSSGEIDLAGWQIKSQSEKIKIIFEAGEKISASGSTAGEFFLLERTDDNSVPNISANKIYLGALSNNSEWLKLFDSNCNLVDEVNASFGWGRFGGENEPKKTLERNLSDLAWHTSESPGGTPRAQNSEPVLAENDSPVVTHSNPPASLPPVESPASSPDSGSETPLATTSTLPVESPVSTSSPQAPPLTSKVLISEVMAGSSSSSDYEFLEIYNYGSEAVDLTGWTIKKKSSSGAESSLVATSRLSGKIIPVGKYFLLAHAGGYNGAVSPDVVWPASYALAYTNNSITIYSVSGAVIDHVSWAEIPKDKSYSRASLDISAGFAVTESPSPQNSQ